MEKVRGKDRSGIKRASAFIQDARIADGKLLSDDDRAVDSIAEFF